MPTAPLTAVVHDAVRRWFQEAHKEAQRGDVVSFVRSGLAGHSVLTRTALSGVLSHQGL